jgi:hypothetical protein
VEDGGQIENQGTERESGRSTPFRTRSGLGVKGALLAGLAITLCISAAHADPVTLLFTVPATNQRVYMAPDPFHGDSLTVRYDCSGGEPTHDLDSILVYRWSISGGLAQQVASVYVRGKEGLPDSAHVDPGPGAHFFALAVDTAGNPSCESPVIYIGPVTGVVADPRVEDPVVGIQLFDVNGRAAHGARASGVYFAKALLKSGRWIRAGKVVLLK